MIFLQYPKCHVFGESLTFLIVFGITLVVYLQTVSPSIAGGDSGELVAEGCQLGTSHPPGYPLYTILVYIVTNLGAKIALSSRSPAYFVNISSCILGAACSGLISCSVLSLVKNEDVEINRYNSEKKKKRDVKKRVDNKINEGQNEFFKNYLTITSAITSGLLHSFSPLAWQYSVTAEVFALHNVFVASIVYTTIRFAMKGTKGSFLLGAFLCGLSLTNQHTSILLVFPLITWVFHATQLYKPRTWVKEYGKESGYQLLGMAVVVFLFGLIPLYATLPVFSFMHLHPGSWGDLSSLNGFINHFMRKDYGTLRLYSGNDNASEHLLERLALWVKDFTWAQANLIMLICLIVTFAECILREAKRILPSLFEKDVKWMRKDTTTLSLQRKGGSGKCYSTNMDNVNLLVQNEEIRVGIVAILSYALLFYLVVFHSLANLPLKTPLLFGVHQRFWMHPNILCFILGGLGLNKVTHKLASSLPSLDVEQGRATSRLVLLTLSLVFAALVSFSYLRGIAKGDHSEHFYMRNYAASILNTLPLGSLLFINYDQQWTSIRYMQECEGLRIDVTSINLSMMSYEWWESKRKLYPKITFPGSHYSPLPSGKQSIVNREVRGFSFFELIEKNYDRFHGQIFIGGHLSFPDRNYDMHYDEVPHGIVRKITKHDDSYDAENTMDVFRKQSAVIWSIVAEEHSRGLPDSTKHGLDTWELTVRREFFDHFISRATHLLDLAVTEGNKNQEDTGKKQLDMPIIKSLVEALSWLEIARMNDELVSGSPSLWKNLGVGYMHMVRTGTAGENLPKLPPVKDLFSDTTNEKLTRSIDNIWWNDKVDKRTKGRHMANDNKDWKKWASSRWEVTWGKFLEMEEAKSDPSYATIKNIYDSVMVSSGKKKHNI